jgi:uncharacterized integral membrane protein
MKLNKKNIRIGLGVTLGVLLCIILIQNSNQVLLSFFALRTRIPLFGVVLISALLGFLLGWLVKSKRL